MRIWDLTKKVLWTSLANRAAVVIWRLIKRRQTAPVFLRSFISSKATHQTSMKQQRCHSRAVNWCQHAVWALQLFHSLSLLPEEAGAAPVLFDIRAKGHRITSSHSCFSAVLLCTDKTCNFPRLNNVCSSLQKLLKDKLLNHQVWFYQMEASFVFIQPLKFHCLNCEHLWTKKVQLNNNLFLKVFFMITSLYHLRNNKSIQTSMLLNAELV